MWGWLASSAPPSPSRHDQWRFLRCVWICVIASIAHAAGHCNALPGVVAGAVSPLFLHAPGEVMKAEGVDGLSRAGARELRASESSQLLRSLVDVEARRHDEKVTLDVFASGDNAVVPRFFARHAEPAAEGVIAFAQPSRAVSRCPACGLRHREFPLIFPPRALLLATVAKLRADGVRRAVRPVRVSQTQHGPH